MGVCALVVKGTGEVKGDGYEHYIQRGAEGGASANCGADDWQMAGASKKQYGAQVEGSESRIINGVVDHVGMT